MSLLLNLHVYPILKQVITVTRDLYQIARLMFWLEELTITHVSSIIDFRNIVHETK